MADALGWRKRIGFVVPSTNTIVQPEVDALRPRGVTFHLARVSIKERPLTSEQAKSDGLAEGARTTAALAASRFGPVLKVSEDGLITCYDGGRVWDL